MHGYGFLTKRHANVVIDRDETRRSQELLVDAATHVMPLTHGRETPDGNHLRRQLLIPFARFSSAYRQAVGVTRHDRIIACSVKVVGGRLRTKTLNKSREELYVLFVCLHLLRIKHKVYMVRARGSKMYY